jgi:hypothetical protein
MPEAIKTFGKALVVMLVASLGGCFLGVGIKGDPAATALASFILAGAALLAFVWFRRSI